MASLTTSHVRGATEAVLIEQSLGAYLETAARRWPAREALVVRHQAVRWSYAELNRRAEDFAAGLLALGLNPGERVGIWSPNNAEWIVSLLACAKAGLILVCMNPA